MEKLAQKKNHFLLWVSYSANHSVFFNIRIVSIVLYSLVFLQAKTFIHNTTVLFTVAG